MNTWTPLFSKIVDSSLWAEPDHVVKVFLTLLALKDADQVVRYNAFAIGRRCWPREDRAEAKVLEALKVLSQPDKTRLEKQPYDGRRIEKVEDGWLLLNGQFYEDMMRKINRREYQRNKQAEYRAKKKGLPSQMPLAGEMAFEKTGQMPHEFREVAVPYQTP